MKTLILMQGASGSGKSTVANALAPDLTLICSTDDYWYRNGFYEFDPAKLGAAHDQNRLICESLMKRDEPTVIVDNTNIKYKDARSYFDLADHYNYEIQVVRVDPGLETCLTRNALRREDRRIPEEVVKRQYANMEDLQRCHQNRPFVDALLLGESSTKISNES